MKKFLMGLSLAVSAFTAVASTSSVKFVAVGNTLESELCVVAAEQGYKAAKAAAKANFVNYREVLVLTTCNGHSIKTFAKSHNTVNEQPQVNKIVIVKPADNTKESELCAAAVKGGLDSITDKVSYDVKELVCNGVSISRFIRYHSAI